MNIGIIGSGVVGQTVGAKLASQDHQVVLGTRDPSNLNEKKGFGSSLADWLAATGDKARVKSFSEAAAHGELAVNALFGLKSVDVLAPLASELEGKLLIDISNALDFSRGMPPAVVTFDGKSLAEAIQEAVPGAKVVKTLSTVTAPLMVNPGLVGEGDHSIFMSGDDPEAKAQAANLLRSFGWTDIIDLGGLATARGVEMMMPAWLQLFGTFGNPMFNYKVVR